ncbi:hypothetical protein KC872_04955, partial [Candidatus Kaiserbacteria bacterium]|nr:hypothetical protein [Candidatus Kaiserbacteria bacterium]
MLVKTKAVAIAKNKNVLLVPKYLSNIYPAPPRKKTGPRMAVALKRKASLKMVFFINNEPRTPTDYT